ncbi:uncharacterized protein ColSpa_08005 [Colletotrichum spaethianum]|uniref:GCN5-related N-acetyltransferase Rv2170-like domain-containing protein n=1 Tax=Colletotrichum spaethianum TaxID=700344 RepID=A0AA37P8Y3_9PEZI|nr:uncharacterized protein ColSpa_08005 [Colletotrichum spaethianum]GKT47824.1 hypothetical protein ColSpa_08005 [Colletotrichum spaethianum]
MSFPNLFLKLGDGTPIAWSFLDWTFWDSLETAQMIDLLLYKGTDGSLSSLHCEPPYRQRGYAKALAAKLFKRNSSDYGPDGWASADVAPDNLGSRGMCKSLNGKHAWNCSWNILQFDEEKEAES